MKKDKDNEGIGKAIDARDHDGESPALGFSAEPGPAGEGGPSRRLILKIAGSSALLGYMAPHMAIAQSGQPGPVPLPFGFDLNIDNVPGTVEGSNGPGNYLFSLKGRLDIDTAGMARVSGFAGQGNFESGTNYGPIYLLEQPQAPATGTYEGDQLNVSIPALVRNPTPPDTPVVLMAAGSIDTAGADVDLFAPIDPSTNIEWEIRVSVTISY